MVELINVMRDSNNSQGLRELCRDAKNYLGKDNLVFVEIGSYMGESAEIFAQELPNATIYCIDPWLPGYDDEDSASHSDFSMVEQQFDLRISKYPNIIKKKGFSTDFKINYDIIYIDGRHFYEGVKEDLLHWLPLRNEKAIISGHDYCTDIKILKIHPHIRGVKQAVDEILLSPLKTYSDFSWLIQIN